MLVCISAKHQSPVGMLQLAWYWLLKVRVHSTNTLMFFLQPSTKPLKRMTTDPVTKSQMTEQPGQWRPITHSASRQLKSCLSGLGFIRKLKSLSTQMGKIKQNVFPRMFYWVNISKQCSVNKLEREKYMITSTEAEKHFMKCNTHSKAAPTSWKDFSPRDRMSARNLSKCHIQRWNTVITASGVRNKKEHLLWSHTDLDGGPRQLKDEKKKQNIKIWN